ncbi:MAG: RHS repeat-associated core domain-containing protein [Spirochaetes bacterium]|nr:RHS repeat-associated core domain-containing protein [Spirochaetota bacterium]
MSEKSFDEQTTTTQCFTSYTRDIEIGLQYAMNRYMDPEIGRFISEDPAKDGLNWYVYANNNPLRWIDPTGLYDDDGYSDEVSLDDLNNSGSNRGPSPTGTEDGSGDDDDDGDDKKDDEEKDPGKEAKSEDKVKDPVEFEKEKQKKANKEAIIAAKEFNSKNPSLEEQNTEQEKAPKSLEEKIAEFGTYLGPGIDDPSDLPRPATINDPNTPNKQPKYDDDDYYAIVGVRGIIDAGTENYGVVNSILLGTGAEGSVKLTTWREKGTDEVSYYKVEVWLGTGEESAATAAISADTYTFGAEPMDFLTPPSEELAHDYLSKHPALVDRAYEQRKATPGERFKEFFGF